MSAAERWLMSALSFVVGASGLSYLWMRYLMTPAEPFAVINHPWQPYALDIHLLSAPVLMIVFGMVWTSHVRGKVATGHAHNRRTGLTSFWAFLVMAGSGYVLQVLTNETAHGLVVGVHVASGLVFLFMYSGHFVSSLRRNRHRRRALRSAA